MRGGGSDLLLGLDLFGRLEQRLGDLLDGLLDAALQAERVGAGRDVAQALANECLSQHGGGGGAVACDVVGLLGDLFDQLSADLLVGVLQLDLLGDGHAIVGDRGGAPLLLQDDVATLGAQRHLYRVGEGVESPLEAAAGLFVIRNCLGHCEVIPPDWGWHVLWSGAVPATDGSGVLRGAASASPSRPSTHRSRVPTAFLALDQGECKVAQRARSPSRTTSVSRSAASGLVGLHRRQPTRSALTSAHRHHARTVPAFCAASNRSPSRPGRRPRPRASRSRRRSPRRRAHRPGRGRSHPTAAPTTAGTTNSASPGSSSRPAARALVDDVPDPVVDHRPEQILLGREVPIDGARADAGPPGDLVDRHRQPLGREGVVGDLEHAGAVAGRVRAQRPVGLSHITPRE